MQYATIHYNVALLFIVFCSMAWAAHKREIEGVEDGMLPKKRPFCNAFTGCGRKRSEPPSSMNDLETDLLLDKLSQQILALVHVLEALHMRIEATKQQQQSPTAGESESRIANFLVERKRRSTKNYDVRTSTTKV